MVGSIWELVSMDGFGSVNWWGFSPAVDLEQHWRGVGECGSPVLVSML